MGQNEYDVTDNGVDLTLIRELLAMTPVERMELLIQSTRNLMKMMEKMRIV